MTRSDQLMLAAIRSHVSFKINEREVTVGEDNRTSVMLHGSEVAIIDFAREEITVNAKTRVSRKSTRVLNSILREYTGCRLFSREHQWILGKPTGLMEPLGTRTICVPILRTTLAQ